MMEQNATILSNVKVARDVYELTLKTDIARMAQPGQFVQVDVPGCFLRRPISICDAAGDTLTLIFKVVGEGTAVMAGLQPQTTVSLLGPLGTGFPVLPQDVVLYGGGVGTPPMVLTARKYLEAGHKVQVVLGFNTKEDVFGLDKFIQAGITPVVCTMDGSAGLEGTVLEAEPQYETALACGPLPMLKAVSDKFEHGYVSLEARMACGYGVCMGCVVKDKEGGSLRVCKDGPVFEIGKVVL